MLCIVVPEQKHIEAVTEANSGDEKCWDGLPLQHDLWSENASNKHMGQFPQDGENVCLTVFFLKVEGWCG